MKPNLPAGHASFHRLRRALAALGWAGVAALPLPTLALSLVGGVQQISNGGPFNGLGPSLSADGSRMAFYSSGNQVGGNADNNFEVYVYDRPSDVVTRITDLPGGILAGGNQAPRISGDGSRVVYQTFFITGGSADFQTFTRNLNTAVTTTVTPRNSFFESAAINNDGSRIVVDTGNTGLRVFDTDTNTLGGVVVGGNGLSFSLSGDGTRIARAGFDGAVNVFDLSNSTTTAVAPAGAGLNVRPDISANGRFVALNATYNPLGSNADGSGEVFVYDLQTNQLRQVTQSLGGTIDTVSINADGTRLAFSSNANLLGTNADGNSEVFVFDMLEDSLLQATDTIGNVFSSDVQLSADGRWLGFTSNGNLTGGNADGSSEVFLLGLSAQPTGGGSVPSPGTAALVLTAGLGAALVTRRRRR